MIHHRTDFRKGVTTRLIFERRQRLQKMLNSYAPDILIISMAESYLRCFKWSWRGIFQTYKMKLPHWVLWCIDSDYREACQEPNDEFETWMRSMLAPREEDK